ncbi:MAG: ABC transporter ATP-binding protein [Lachnospiraceae bacterium]
MEQNNAVEIRDLRKDYQDFTLCIPQFSLPRGCIMGLIGENGAGKSTLIRLIMGLVHQQEGEITLLGQDNRQNLHLLKEDIGVVLGEIGIPEILNPVQVGKIMRDTFSRWNQSGYEELIERWRLPSNKKFKDFSRGMKMKQQLAVALSHEAKLLILDEATNGLDPVIRDEILDILEEYTRCEKHTVLLSSHIVSDLEKISDYIAFLHKGRLLLCEEKDRMLERYGLLNCSQEEFAALPQKGVWVKRRTAYGIEAIVDRNLLLGNRGGAAEKLQLRMSPAGLEDIFVAMVKKEAAI